jgi:hypothetical protein
MRLEETTYDNSETGCCEHLDPDEWNGRELEWQDKPFLKDHFRSIAYMPVNIGSVMKRDHEAVTEAEAFAEEPFWLTGEVSPWGSNVYLAVDRDVPDQEIVHLSGNYLTRLFDGPYRDTGKWVEEMKAYVEREGHEVDDIYFYYAQCPDCSEKLGVNQVVLFAKVG